MDIKEKQSYNELFGVNPKNILSNKEIEDIVDKENEKTRKESKKYRTSHKEYFKIAREKYTAKKKTLPASLTVKQWKQIKQSFDNKCAYCGRELPLTKDHFIPVTKNGEYTLNNIVPACRSCNVSKHNKDFFQWYPVQNFYSKDREKKILKYLGYKNNEQQLKIG